MNGPRRIGLLGGTFDPIHTGHVQTAVSARQVLRLDRVILLPSRVPPHRQQQPLASRYHRFAMAALAINGVEGLEASDLELCAPGPSYTADTLIRFSEHTGVDASQIFFITGADAFAEIETWHRYPEVLELAHFVVVSRPGFRVEALRGQLPTLARRMSSIVEPRNLQPANQHDESPDGKEAGNPRDFLTIFLIDVPTPAVSSTEIRRRLRAGESARGLVAPAVDWHIAQHRLYAHDPASSTADHLHGEH
jgi:nicotinate-nucleotide adenylyltransferase